MIYYSFSIRWYSLYSQPPAGMPRVLISDVIMPNIKRWSSRNTPGCIDLIYDQMQREGLPYVVSIQSHKTQPPRKQSLAGKQSRRRKLLMGRLMKKYPLLAEQMYQEAIASKPEYYGIKL